MQNLNYVRITSFLLEDLIFVFVLLLSVVSPVQAEMKTVKDIIVMIAHGGGLNQIVTSNY